ncbi:MAG: glycine/betaine ABC transporter substrate-binding protein [Defluviitaleaceae bacterium]|nr:glycine/betaine ABC transporter substrate-binding protein [Defluviitaleaceae bacterium]
MKKIIAILATLVIFLTACAGGGAASSYAIAVGSKDFTEQLILGQITLQVLAAHGIEVIDRTNITGTENVRAALDNGDIDIYWEYTGTAWMMLMGQELIHGETPEELFERVRANDAENGIIWLDFAPFNNTYALAVTQETSQAFNMRTLSDLAAIPGLTLATEHEFMPRPDGFIGMVEAYEGMEFGEIMTMFMGIVYDTLMDGQADVGVVHGTDGRILYHNLVVLEDDLNFFPIYTPAPNIRADSLERFPEIADILRPISAALNMDVMQGLNLLVDSGQMEPDEAAAQWLRENDFI